MSQAFLQFEQGIKDSEELLAHFDSINQSPLPASAEVLKRAGLVMALTAWETYVEDRVTEEMGKRLQVLSGSYAGEFIRKRLEHDLKTFHNPNSEKTRRLFLEYLNVDVTQGWVWQHFEQEKACEYLNKLISKRGDAVHRSKSASNGSPMPHLVKRDELEKAIRFTKDLVKATENFLAKSF